MLIEEHEAAFIYDWRTRFGLPLRSVFDGTLTWHEAWALTQELCRDPSSHVGAAVAGMKHPWSYESAILADTFDLLMAANTDEKARGQVKPYPRPLETRPDGERSKRPNASQQDIRRALARRGHVV